jgi:hypothetical protein
VLFALRVTLPDRRGSLAQVATSLAGVGADLVALDVVDRRDGIATDGFCVEAEDGLAEAIRRSVETVPGVIVEAIRPVGVPPDPCAPLDLASCLTAAAGNVVQVLVDGLPHAMWASWCMAVHKGVGGPQILAASGRAPARATFEAPWLPVERGRRLEPAPWMPSAWRMRAGVGSLELAVAPLGEPGTGLLLAREWGARFLPVELRQLETLAAIAGARLGMRVS